MSTVSSCRRAVLREAETVGQVVAQAPTTNVGQAGRCVAGLFRYRSSYSSFSDSSRRAFSRLGTAGDHQHELAARLRPPEMLQHFGRRSAHGLLELLGQLARHGHRSFGPERLHRTVRDTSPRGRAIRRRRIVRSSEASSCKRLLRPFFWGRNPSKQKRSQGKPLCTSAGMQAVAPGASPSDPPARRRCAPAGIPDRRYPAFRRRRSALTVRPRRSSRPRRPPWRVR